MSQISNEPVYEPPNMFEVDLSTVRPELRPQAETLLGALAALEAQVLPICAHDSRLPQNEQGWFYEEVTPEEGEKSEELISLVVITVKDAENFLADKPHYYAGVKASKTIDRLLDVAKAEETVFSEEEFPLKSFAGSNKEIILDARTILPALKYIRDKKLHTKIGPSGSRFLHDLAKGTLRDYREGKIKLRFFHYATDHTHRQAL